METRPPTNDPKTIWQHQPTEPLKMSAEEIRHKLQKRRAKARLQFVALCSVVLVFVGFSAFNFVKSQEPPQRAGYGVSIIWGLCSLYPISKRIGPRNEPGDEALTTHIEFSRKELERWWEHSQVVCCWILGPIFLTLATLFAPVVINVTHDGDLVKALPAFGLLAIWIVLLIGLRRCGRMELRREIEELKALENDQS